MKNREEILEIVNRPYVGDTCVQVSVGYNESLTIFNKRGILYHDIIDYPCVHVPVRHQLQHVLPPHCKKAGGCAEKYGA